MVFGMGRDIEGFEQAAQFEEEEEEQYEVEDQTKQTSFKLEFVDKTCSTLSGELLVIAIGNSANAFVETYFKLPNEHVAKVCLINATEASTKSKKQLCFIYRVENYFVCLMKYQVLAECAYSWIREVVCGIKTKNTVVLCSAPKSLFIGDDELKVSDCDILRYMKTSAMDLDSKIQLLEEGNMLKDLPAAVLSHCQAVEHPAALYVTFTESHFVDGFTLKCFQPSLNDPVMKPIVQVSKSVLYDRLKNFEGCGVADNNVYI